jgi:hypothetical protein
MARRSSLAIPTFDEFASRAKAIAAAIPAEFLEGVEDIAIHREAQRHPLLSDVVTLGECEPSRLGAMVGSETVRSIVHLYYGSFVDLARRDPAFRLDAELRETIEHEIQHHIEDRAGVRTLIDEDDLFDAHQRFLAGLDAPKGWWRHGERLEPNVYAVEGDLFVELRLRRAEFDARRGKPVALTVLDEPFEAEIPADCEPGEILTFEGDGLVADADDGEDGGGHEHKNAHSHAHGRNADPKARAAARESDDNDDEAPDAGDLHLVIDVR